jgi:GNAT superfamily N-acetyltransferase
MDISQLIFRKAKIEDLKSIIHLLIDDDLGNKREKQDKESLQVYIDAFNKIYRDSNQHLIIVEFNNIIIETAHLTIIPSLTFIGSTRMQIEAVRVAKKYQNHGIGKHLIEYAITYAKSQNAKIIQLTTNKERNKALKFYLSCGFKNSHEGLKLYL